MVHNPQYAVENECCQGLNFHLFQQEKVHNMLNETYDRPSPSLSLDKSQIINAFPVDPFTISRPPPFSCLLSFLLAAV